MKAKKCKNGHFFNAETHIKCPHCEEMMAKDNQIISANIPEYEKTPFAKTEICLYSGHIEEHNTSGIRIDGEHRLVYNNIGRVVTEQFYSRGEGGDVKCGIYGTLKIPDYIKYEEDLLEYIKVKRSEWEFLLRNYRPIRTYCNQITESLPGIENTRSSNMEKDLNNRSSVMGLMKSPYSDAYKFVNVDSCEDDEEATLVLG